MKKHWNWMLAGGFLLSVAGLLSYFMVFTRFPVTRDFPWASLLIFAVALTLLGVGLWRAYARADRYRGKIFGPILSLLSVSVFGLFIFYVFFLSYGLPASAAAPKVGDVVHDFTLPDQNGEPFQLSQAIPAVTGMSTEVNPSGPWVLLVFYRGYW